MNACGYVARIAAVGSSVLALAATVFPGASMAQPLVPDAAAAAAAPQALPPLPTGARPGWQGAAVALSAARLDRLRGGFQTAGGLQLSFGIERVVYINGVLSTTTRINVEGLGAAADRVGPAAPLPEGSRLAWVNNGAGNTLLQGLPSPANLGTVIQNSLNDQHIQTLTIINANANSLDVLRGWSLQMSIRDAVTGAVRR